MISMILATAMGCAQAQQIEHEQWLRKGYELHGPAWLPEDDIRGTPCVWDESKYMGWNKLSNDEKEWLRLGFKLHRCGK